MTREQRLWFYCSVLLFIAGGALVLLKFSFLSVAYAFIPLVFICAGLAIFSIERLYYLVVFLTPLSLNLSDIGEGLALSLPVEPMLLGLTVLYLMKKLISGNVRKEIVFHPVSIFIYLILVWTLICSITSEIPIVSFKFLISKVWFVTVFFFLALDIFLLKKSYEKIAWFYGISLGIVVVITLVKHARFNFSEDTANWIVSPLYNDHTAYAAALAMFLPVLVFFTARKSGSRRCRMFSVGLLSLLTLAIILSYTRAAWVSLVGALGVLGLILLRIKFRTILVTSLICTGLILLFQGELLMSLEKNNQDSSENFTEHIQSITNISSDASNLERLNRWNCAVKMFKERPVLGWGPGTYSFLYAPYQEAKDKTIISTNFGNGGNAHSEYLGPMAESGIIGGLLMVLLMLYSFSLGFKLAYRIKEKELRWLVIVTFLGLATYYIHGVLNNFLDTDKASAPFWGFLAILTAIDITTKKRLEKATGK